MITVDKEVLQKALSEWQISAQLGMAQEECAELIVAINKFFRADPKGREMIIEEVADCFIVLEQLVLIFGERYVQSAIDEKVTRLRKKLKMETMV